MFGKLTAKQQVILLIAAFFAGLLLVYSVAIKSTVNAGNTYRDLKGKARMMEYAPEKIVELQKQMVSINNVISSSVQSESDLHQQLLGVISSYCQKNRLVIKAFPEIHSYARNDLAIETNMIVIEGGYIKLLKLLYMLETQKQFGKIASVDFSSYFDRKSKRYKLTMKLYIQNINYADTEKNI